jgi:hypothetical protein
VTRLRAGQQINRGSIPGSDRRVSPLQDYKIGSEGYATGPLNPEVELPKRVVYQLSPSRFRG